jgi:hypothetical protein
MSPRYGLFGYDSRVSRVVVVHAPDTLLRAESDIACESMQGSADDRQEVRR